MFLSVGFASASVSTLKQHCLVDVLGGVALGTLVGVLIITPYEPRSTPRQPTRGV